MTISQLPKKGPCLDGDDLDAVHTAHIPLAQTWGVAHGTAGKVGKDRQEPAAICSVHWEGSIYKCSKRIEGSEGTLAGSERALPRIQDLPKHILFEKASLSNFQELSILFLSFQIVLSRSHQPAWCYLLVYDFSSLEYRQQTPRGKRSNSQEKGLLPSPSASSSEPRIGLGTQQPLENISRKVGYKGVCGNPSTQEVGAGESQV